MECSGYVFLHGFLLPDLSFTPKETLHVFYSRLLFGP